MNANNLLPRELTSIVGRLDTLETGADFLQGFRITNMQIFAAFFGGRDEFRNFPVSGLRDL